MGDEKEAKTYLPKDPDWFYKEFGVKPASPVTFDRSLINNMELEKVKSIFIHLSVDIKIYSGLFSDTQSIEILNSFNPLIFSRFQVALAEKICMTFARLDDPGKMRSNRNLSLRKIVNDCGCPEPKEIYDTYATKLKELNLRKWRAKVIAHNDLSNVMNKEIEDLDITAEKFESLIIELGNVLDELDGEYGINNPDIVVNFDKSPSSFLYHLKSSFSK